MIIMFPYFSKTRHDHATPGHSDIINCGLIPTLITSYVRANIYRFIYSTCLNKHYQKHTHQSCINIFIYIHSPIILNHHLITLNHPLVIILLGNSTTNHEWRISPSSGIQFESPPFKVKNNMLWNTLQTFTQIGRLTKRKMQFYETCAD